MKRLACCLLGLALPLHAAAQTVREAVSSAPGTAAAAGPAFINGSGFSPAGSLDTGRTLPAAAGSVVPGAGTASPPGGAGAAAGSSATGSTESMLPSVAAASKVVNAMSAAPAAIAANATVLDLPPAAGAASPLLRSGSNGWTCYPDDPATPGNDPVCMDAQFLAFQQALLDKRTPAVTGTGLAYKLQGGSEASNTDPYASQPAAGQDWVSTPPHLLLVSPQRWDSRTYPGERNANAGTPFLRFPGTPYEHLEVPLTTPVAPLR